jgi:acetyl-CoA C-acetyltransferase
MNLTPVIVAARRTAIGTAGKAFRDFTVVDLLAPVLSAVADELHMSQVDDVVIGVARGPGGNVARVAALQAQLGLHVPGMTVDRQCGSGLAAIQVAAALVASGAATVVLAGGAESCTNASPGRAAFAPSDIGDPDMGPAAETVAEDFAISRERQDALAMRSHENALRATQIVASEIVAVGNQLVDQRPRKLDANVLARMPAAFTESGTVTAGNSCGVSDGAAVVAIVPEWFRAERGLAGLRILGWTAVGVDPRTPGIGPAPAIKQLLDRCGVELDHIGAIEIVEAFAAQVLAVTDALGLDPLGRDAHRVAPLGGAIALGHPWGASGAMVVVRLFTELLRGGITPSPRYGLAACAVGGGQGLALLVERVDA